MNYPKREDKQEEYCKTKWLHQKLVNALQIKEESYKIKNNGIAVKQ